MKVIAACIASFCLFWLGHAVSRVMLRADWLSFLYPVYNRLMLASSDVEEWAGVEVMWRSPQEADLP